MLKQVKETITEKNKNTHTKKTQNKPQRQQEIDMESGQNKRFGTKRSNSLASLKGLKDQGRRLKWMMAEFCP